VLLQELTKERLFYYFSELAKIPHGSRNTKQISDYCVRFAKERGLEYHQDELNNVIIIKKASKGRENDEPLILQGHLDMVCEKAEGVTKDMTAEGLDLFIDGDFLGAEGTTLGGDDGIAVAMILSILEDEELSHPRLEAVFTVDEEIGMLGAAAIDVSPLKGHTMLNIDSEAEGIFTVSCAGGVVASLRIPVSRELTDKNVYSIDISGLTGGHSGIEIHKGRASANKVMAGILKELFNRIELGLISVDGGLKDNAIPVACSAIIVCDAELNELSEIIRLIAQPIAKRYKETDPGMKIDVNLVHDNKKASMVEKDTKKVIDALHSLPEGVQEMSPEIEGLVQTSLNMGILTTTEDHVEMSYCVRSSVDNRKNDLTDILKKKAEETSGELILSGDYPGWQYKQDSVLRDRMVEIYKEQYGKSPVIEAVHAGVECGLFAGKISGLDCVSYGPNLLEIHTYRERMDIESARRVYAFTRRVIEDL
jgi:dipeptidase D